MADHDARTCPLCLGSGHPTASHEQREVLARARLVRESEQILQEHRQHPKLSEKAGNEKFLEDMARFAVDSRAVILGVLLYRPGQDDEVWIYNSPGIPMDEIFALTGWPRKSKD